MVSQSKNRPCKHLRETSRQCQCVATIVSVDLRRGPILPTVGRDFDSDRRQMNPSRHVSKCQIGSGTSRDLDRNIYTRRSTKRPYNWAQFARANQPKQRDITCVEMIHTGHYCMQSSVRRDGPCGTLIYGNSSLRVATQTGSACFRTDN